MKIWAKARVERESAKKLILAFFGDEFHPESSIEIKGNQARVLIVFEKQPLKILEALTDCELYELFYGKLSEDFKEETSKEEDNPEEVEISKEEDNSEEAEKSEEVENPGDENNSEEEVAPEEEAPEEKVAPVGKRTRKRNLKEATLKQEPLDKDIAEITEIAKKSTSYEHFVHSVAEWIEPSKEERQLFITKLIKAATQVDVINWKNIEKIFTEEEFQYKPSVRVGVSNSVTKKFADIQREITILNALKIFVKYQNFAFCKDGILENEISYKRVKMQCMPEIPWFEEVLGRIDKTQPIKNRVEFVLAAMKIDEQSIENQKIISAVINAAIIEHDNNSNSIYVNFGKQYNKSKAFVQLTISAFVNRFIELNSNSKEKIIVSHFINDLRKVVMLESEIGELSE